MCHSVLLYPSLPPSTHTHTHTHTQLHVAAANGYMEVLDFLFAQEGVNLNIADNEGWTPFHAAVCWGQKEAMKMLAQKGVDMDAKDLHGDTAYGMYYHEKKDFPKAI